MVNSIFIGAIILAVYNQAAVVLWTSIYRVENYIMRGTDYLTDCLRNKRLCTQLVYSGFKRPHSLLWFIPSSSEQKEIISEGTNNFDNFLLFSIR